MKLGTRRLRIGILPKLCLTMAAVMLVPLATIWFLDYRASVDHLSRDIEERLQGGDDVRIELLLERRLRAPDRDRAGARPVIVRGAAHVAGQDGADFSPVVSAFRRTVTASRPPCERGL